MQLVEWDFGKEALAQALALEFMPEHLRLIMHDYATAYSHAVDVLVQEYGALDVIPSIEFDLLAQLLHMQFPQYSEALEIRDALQNKILTSGTDA